ncbi:Ger(x)C family spore germination protein [Paenibacillus aestuarii]|uniref:Ger(X)C family spore germination protein n=1 Tax=Paenibacillus aestuarii TaxID=516965 RepID=A0ABW0KCW7_9BACL|nr:Ger(x)C family spore germination protein [Paenibacillus aestuarii]
MRSVKKLLMGCMILLSLVSCSPDVREISDIALVMITGIDFDAKTKTYTFTAYCILPTTTSTDKKTGNSNEWVASASGNSIMEATRNLRSRAGKMLIWQHDKFFIIGEQAAKYAMPQLVDFLTRNRDIRGSSYLIVSEGRVANKLTIKGETNDLLANELLGKVLNERLWGKSLSMQLKDVTDYLADPYRGFITSRLTAAQPADKRQEVLYLNGGSVFHKGHFIGWMNGEKVIVVHLLTYGRGGLSKLEFPQTFHLDHTQITMLLRNPKRTIHYHEEKGKQKMTVDLNLQGVLMDSDKPLSFHSKDSIAKLEQTISSQLQETVNRNLYSIQKELKVDVFGYSDFISKHDPKSWSTLKSQWGTIFPEMPIQVTVHIQVTSIGMKQ